MTSEIVNYLDDELTTLFLSATNPKVLASQRMRLRESLIPSINKQINMFKHQAFDAIEQEVYEEILTETDFESLSKENHIAHLERINLQFRRPNIRLLTISQDVFDKLALSEINTDEFKQHLSSVYSSVRDFEIEMKMYKNDLKEFLIDKLLLLAQKYKATIDKTFLLNRTKIHNDYKTLKGFVKMVLEVVLSI